MGRFRIALVLAGIFIVALAAGRIWNLRPAHGETDHTRRGQIALLGSPEGAPIWLAIDRRDTYRLQQAMAQGEQTFLDEAANQEKAFPVASGSEVRVIGSSVSKREVEVLEGPHTGQTGWVEFDILMPPREYKRPIQPNPRRRY